MLWIISIDAVSHHLFPPSIDLIDPLFIIPLLIVGIGVRELPVLAILILEGDCQLLGARNVDFEGRS